MAGEPDSLAVRPATIKRPLSQFAGHYGEWEPAAPLQNHISCLWVNDLSHSSASEFHVVPDGCVDIVWTGESLCAAGPDTRPILEQVWPGRRTFGIRFHPGAAHPWLGVPLSEILNARVPLAEFWKQEADRLADCIVVASDSVEAVALIQEALLRRIHRVGFADRQIAFLRRSAAAVRGDSDIGGVRELSLRMGIGERTLRRRCMDAFGYGFKTLHRILRFQRLFHLAAQTHSNLADLATEADFADQAHMSRELRRLCDATPAEFVALISH
jgi:AraC-like DNA-binding protein